MTDRRRPRNPNPAKRASRRGVFWAFGLERAAPENDSTRVRPSKPAPIRILLVDDDEDEWVLTRDRLMRIPGRPYTLDWASTYEAALPLLASTAYDLYLLDYQLGPYTGVDLLRAGRPNAPAVLLTQRTEDEIDAIAMAAGAEDFLTKGEATSALLARTIRHALERWRSRQGLAQREQDLRHVLLALPELLAQIHNDAIVFSNRAFDEAVSDAARATVIEVAHRLQQTGGQETLHLPGSDGDELEIEVSLLPLAEAEEGANWLWIGRDVTERRRMVGRWMAADRLSSVATLAAGIAHEVNNPLAFMTSNLEYVRAELELLTANEPEARREELVGALTEALEGAERVRDVVGRLRGFSQTTNAEATPLQLAEHVEWAEQMTAVETNPRATLVREIEPTPAVMGNRAQVRHCLVNLVLNASQAFDAPDPQKNRITLRLRAGQESGRPAVLLEVEDNGRGIPAAQLARIFDPFYTTRAPGQGMGLGLATCAQIAQEMGGHIAAESRVGGGTLFRIVLPALDGD